MGPKTPACGGLRFLSLLSTAAAAEFKLMRDFQGVLSQRADPIFQHANRGDQMKLRAKKAQEDCQTRLARK